MLAPSGNNAVAGRPSSRFSELGIVLPAPPTPLGAYVESSDTDISRWMSKRAKSFA